MSILITVKRSESNKIEFIKESFDKNSFYSLDFGGMTILNKPYHWKISTGVTKLCVISKGEINIINKGGITGSSKIPDMLKIDNEDINQEKLLELIPDLVPINKNKKMKRKSSEIKTTKIIKVEKEDKREDKREDKKEDEKEDKREDESEKKSLNDKKIDLISKEINDKILNYNKKILKNEEETKIEWVEVLDGILDTLKGYDNVI